eukprot:gene12325-5999_t
MNEKSEKSFSVESFSEEKLDSLKEEFQNVKTNIGVSLYDLSLKHSLVLIFIKWYGCITCQEVIAEVGRLLPPMLKLNTIPIIVHQGDEKVAVKFHEKSKDMHVPNLLYAKTTKKIQDLLGIVKVSVMKHFSAMMKMDMINSLKDGRYMDMPFKVINPLSAFAVVVLEKGKVSRKIIYETFEKRLDFPLLLPGNNSVNSSKVMTEILQYFPNFDWKNEFIRTNSRIFDMKAISKNYKMETKKVGYDLVEFLENDLSRYYLKAFATLEFSVENILICEEVEKFKSLKNGKNYDPTEELAMAKHILEYYLKEGAYMQVNIPVKMAKEVEEMIKNVEKSKEFDYEFDCIFDAVINDVRSNCIADTFCRFLK